MRKGTRMLIMGIILSIGIMGCHSNKHEISVARDENKYNTAFKAINTKENDDVIGVVVNNPTQDELSKVPILDSYTDGIGEEVLMVLPRYNQSKIIVQKIEYTQNELIPIELLYSKEHTQDGFGLCINTIRSEGIPGVMITIIYEDKTLNYLVTSNGKEGEKKIEYLIK